jgi:DNA-binding transcriptional ArsR family regulator
VNKLDRAAALLKSSAHPLRLAILNKLLAGEANVKELVKVSGKAQPNVSQHLAKMKSDRLVIARRDKQRVYYSINGDEAKVIIGAVASAFKLKAA